MPSLMHVGHWSLASLLQPSVSHSLRASVLAMPSSAGGVVPASDAARRMCTPGQSHYAVRSNGQKLNLLTQICKMAAAEPVSTHIIYPNSLQFLFCCNHRPSLFLFTTRDAFTQLVEMKFTVDASTFSTFTSFVCLILPQPKHRRETLMNGELLTSRLTL